MVSFILVKQHVSFGSMQILHIKPQPLLWTSYLQAVYRFFHHKSTLSAQTRQQHRFLAHKIIRILSLLCMDGSWPWPWPLECVIVRPWAWDPLAAAAPPGCPAAACGPSPTARSGGEDMMQDRWWLYHFTLTKWKIDKRYCHYMLQCPFHTLMFGFWVILQPT